MWELFRRYFAGVASRIPKVFNQAKSSPKDQNGKVKSFDFWSLSDLINVGFETGYLGLDVKKFSHALRDFRNYIHQLQTKKMHPDPPYEDYPSSIQLYSQSVTVRPSGSSH